MDGVPTLSTNELKTGLEAAYGSKRAHHLFAFFGTGEEQVLKIDETEAVRVLPVRSELELREKLPELGDAEARIAFLVPFVHDVPIDIAGRFAWNGRVRRIGKDARVHALFGVADVDDDARKLPLLEYLLRPANAGARYPIGDARLTTNAAWSVWLRTDWGIDTQGGASLDTLLAFAAVNQRGAEFVEAMRDPSASKTRDALLEWLDQRIGPAGSAVWRAWEKGRGARALALALALEPLARSEHVAVSLWARMRVREDLEVTKDTDIGPVGDALGLQAAGAMRVLERSLTVPELRAFGRAADALVVDEEIRAKVFESPRLPSAWAARLAGLGAALSTGLQLLHPEATAEAIRALRSLESHAFFKDDDQATTLKRAEMAVRLLCWLVARPDRQVDPGNTSYGDTEALGRWYAAEGGFVDRARRAARGHAEDGFGKAVEAVVAAADDARAVLDRRFARSLASWVEAGQPASEVLPIYDATKRIAAPFLEGNSDRRLLVLLFDGMAWSQAAELLESLGERASPWGPLAWHGAREGRIGEAPLPVVLAALPTVTEVSRSSFFAGKLFGPETKVTTSDVDHWAANPAMKKLAPAGDIPRLLLGGDARTPAGGVSQAALSLIGDRERRVVALVINAIDDSLKASNEVRHKWRVENIASLPDILDKAREHGRSVLIASDHGHIPADRVRRIRSEGGAEGARWRRWQKPDDPIAENEVGFSGKRVWAPPGNHGAILLADDTSVYLGSPHVGAHGGATLAEVVVPCLLIGCADNVDATTKDPGIEVRTATVPRWWHFDVAETPTRDEQRAPTRKPKKPDAQLAFPTVPPAEQPTPVAVAPPKQPAPAPVPASPFGKSAVLKAQARTAVEREQVVAAVDLLLSKQGVMSADAFGASMNLFVFRVGGFISRLQEVLNLDGYEVIRYDPISRQVHLDRQKLAQLFEVNV